MFKTVPWLVLALILPLGMAGVGMDVEAADDFVPSGDEWTAFPDLATDSGRFLAVSGSLNSGLPGSTGAAPEQLVLQLFFLEAQDVAIPDSSLVRVGVFDGDAKGLWDQRDDLPPVAEDIGAAFARPYNTRYRLYADPNGDVADALVSGGLNAPDPVTPEENVISNGAQLVLTDGTVEDADTKWVEIANRPGDGSARGEIVIDGQVFDYYAYTLRVNLEPLPDEDLTGFELNGFKLAYTGIARLPENTVFGIIGGAVDIRTVNGIARTEDPLPGDDIPGSDDQNQFDGTFDIPFSPLYACDDIVLREADADWNKVIPQLGDNSPTGIPPDDGGQYWSFDFFSGNFRWVTNIDFKIELPAAQQSLGRHGISWELFDPSGTERLNSEDGTTATHPSITADQQTGPAAPFQASDPIGKDVINAFPPTVDGSGNLVIPTWTWRWYGVDARNLVWLKGGLGPDLNPQTSVFIGCLPDSTGFAADFTLEYVGPTTNSTTTLQALTTSTIQGQTDATGNWASADLAPGTWQVTAVTPLSTAFTWAAVPALPYQFTVDVCDGGEAEILGTCTPIVSKANISGKVYCDDDQSGTYGAPPDSALGGVEVKLFKSGETDPTATTTTNAAGDYTFPDVDEGTWVVSVDATQDALEYKLALSNTQLTVALVGGVNVTGQDFRFLCIGDLSGRVYCDNDQSGSYVSPPDKPLGGVRVEIRELGQTALFAFTLTKTGLDTDPTTGTYVFEDLPAGEYTVSVDETQTTLDGTTPLSAMTRDETVLAGEETEDVDFRLLCPAVVSGHVWLDLRPCDPLLNGDELPIEEVFVELIRQDGPAPVVVATVQTDALGFFEFKPVEPGEYTIRVPWAELDPTVNAAVAFYKPFAPPSAILGPINVEPLSSNPDNDFFFCPSELKIKVVKRPKGADDCFNVVRPGDLDLSGVEVVVTPISPDQPDFSPTVFLTDINGEILIENIKGGTYEVSVNPTQPILLGLEPGKDASGGIVAILQDVTVPVGDAAEAVSVWCEKIEFCTITGEVRRKGADCITWWLGGGIGDITVELRDKDGTLEDTTTAVNGTFEFADLDKDLAPFTVSIPDGQTLLADLTYLGLEPTQVVTECPAHVVFEYGSAGLEVQIWFDLSCSGIPTSYTGLKSDVVFEELFGAMRTWNLVTDDDGTLLIPSATIRDLLPGMYKVTVTPINTSGLVAPWTRSETIDLALCQGGSLEFVYCGVGSIKGRVIKQLIDCDGVIQDGEPGIVGVDIELIPRTVGQTPRTTQTVAGGWYEFLNLPRGEYDVRIADTTNNALLLANLRPDGATNVFVGLVPPNEYVVDFLYCAYAKVHGYVFKEPVGDCGNEFIQPSDTELEGVTVRLLLADGTEIDSVETDASGEYEFNDIEWWRGPFVVSVDRNQGALPFYLSPNDDREVGPFELASEETKRFDFGYCQQQLSGTVFLEPYGDCDGILQVPPDVGIKGVTVRLVQTAGDYVGMEWEQVTDDNGFYLFEDLPVGEYDVWVPATAGDNPTLLAGTTETSTQPLQPVLLAGEWKEDQDFGYCPEPDPARIFGKVFCNPLDKTCDVTFEAGDEPILGALVELYDATGVFLTDTTTDVNGDYSFEDLLPGTYTVTVPYPQGVFGDCKPNSPFLVEVTLVAGDSKQVDFALCEPPCEVPCCIGDLHELVVETKFWVGEIDEGEERWFDIYSYLFDGCDCRARQIDYAGVYYTGDFPGAVDGYNDVLTLESVYVQDGWAVVRLRLTAQGCLFPRGYFGKKCRTVAVWFNGKWKYGHASFRCECVRPGSWFTWSEECGFPECEETFSPDVLASMMLEGRPEGCEAEFLTVDTLSYDTWLNCEFEKPECVDQSESCKCGYNVVEFELDYWVNHEKWVERGELNTYKAILAKWGTDIIDGLEFDFEGQEWKGEVVGENGKVVVTHVRRIDPVANGYEPNSYYDLWRATILVRACERADGHPGVLPEQLEARTKLAEFPYKYWLELSPWNETCLKLGMRTWNGEPVGANILWWRNVLDAAWCPPQPCVREGDCCTGYCEFCPEPEGECDETQASKDCGCSK